MLFQVVAGCAVAPDYAALDFNGACALTVWLVLHGNDIRAMLDDRANDVPVAGTAPASFLALQERCRATLRRLGIDPSGLRLTATGLRRREA